MDKRTFTAQLDKLAQLNSDLDRIKEHLNQAPPQKSEPKDLSKFLDSCFW